MLFIRNDQGRLLQSMIHETSQEIVKIKYKGNSSIPTSLLITIINIIIKINDFLLSEVNYKNVQMIGNITL